MLARTAARLAVFALACGALSAEVKRVVIIKVDGVPAAVLERELARVDPVTHLSSLPWIDHVFEQGGTRVSNFYVRAISLSAPSWSMLDTGHHLEIHGNAEFDRYTYHVYDYLNFFPFYFGYALSRRVDMPGVEVLDDLKIPLLADRFPAGATYQGFQLYQRGVRWQTLEDSLKTRFAHRSIRELMDEWTMGFEIGNPVEEQTEQELIAKLADPKVRYLDYFTGDFDHIAHSTPDPIPQRLALQRIDALIGRIWTAIEKSPLASETALVVVSDHGMNTTPGVYSQGYDLVQFFNSRAGGGHHVVTNRHLLDQYSLKGLNPFVSEVITPSDQSLYLKGEANQYPTALLDLDGNERASVYLRNSDLNALQILEKEIHKPEVPQPVQREAIEAFLKIVDRRRGEWSSNLDQLNRELNAANRWVQSHSAEVETQAKKWTRAERDAGLDLAARRLAVQAEATREQVREYSAYAANLSRLLNLSPADLAHRSGRSEDLIPRHAMGDANTVYDLQNYVIGPAPGGLVLAPDGSLDVERSFQRVNYFPLLVGLSVRNNVQAAVGPRPVDFIAMRIRRTSLALRPDETPGEDPIWLYASEDRQALILSRYDSGGNLELRYLPVAHLRQDSDGAIHLEEAQPAPRLPLQIFEDPDFAVPEADRQSWLGSWHSELDWLHAVHQTKYSDGIIALHEQFLREEPRNDPGDAGLLESFSARRRRLAEPDFVIFANDHWNFNVRGFNPGGNHGSFFRISTRSVLMLAGGSDTGIPRHQQVREPYDSLSFVPTILEMMGLYDEGRAGLPGRVIREILPPEPRQPSP